MEKQQGGCGTLTGAVWAAVLAPAVSVLPGLAAKVGGQAGWLAPLVVLPAALLLAKLLGFLTAGRGLAAALLDVPGRHVGHALTIIYIMWALVLGAARVRLMVRRLEFAAQRETGAVLFLVVPVLVALWLVRGKAAAFVRTGAVFARVLTVALTGLLVLMLFQVRKENLFPLWFEDGVSALKAAVPAFGVLCCGVYGAFLRDGTTTQSVGRQTVGGCAVLVLLVLVVLGNLGAELTAALEDPFLTLSRQVGVKGAFQRIESLVAALWLLADLAFLGMLLWACRRMSETAFSEREGRWSALIGAAVIVLAAATVLSDAAVVRQFEYWIAPWGNLVLGVAVPCALSLRKKAGAYLVPGTGEKR